jgi:signal transduction histidine kinase
MDGINVIIGQLMEDRNSDDLLLPFAVKLRDDQGEFAGVATLIISLYKINPEEGRKRAKEIRDLSRGALAEMRTLLLELRPSALTSVTLPDLLRQLCDGANGRALVPISFHAEGEREIPE